jgi:arylsulfatase
LLVLAALTLLVPRSAQGGDAAPGDSLKGKRPNIILVLTDDQGYGDASCNGNPILKTPNIDRMHREGVHFEDFHVSPTCAPTRSSIMTGRHEFRNGITHTIFERERLTLKATTIVQLLKAAGYTTGIFGKWHLGDEPDYWPTKRGFDEMFIHGAGGIGQTYAGSCGDAPGNSYFDPVILHNGAFVKTQGYCTDVFFAQAMKWIESVKSKQPFFACVTTNAPHGPLICPDEYEAKYKDKVPGADDDGKENTKSKKGNRNDVAKFFGMVANIDDNVGKLLDKVKALGLDDNTLVIFMNDNGGTAGCGVWNAGMRGTKGTAHNGGTRGMSLWRWPGTLKPAACEKLTAHIDIFPTFAELAGAKVPETVAAKLEGFSLLPLLEKPDAPWHDDRMLVTHVGRWQPGTEPVKYGACSVRWQQYLMVRDGKRWALHDLKADPGEKTDVSDKHADVVEKLDKAYDTWWEETLPCLDNEAAHKTAPKINTFKELYWKQFKGPGPNNVKPPADLAL